MNNANEVVEKLESFNQDEIKSSTKEVSNENFVKVEKKPRSILSIFSILIGVFISVF